MSSETGDGNAAENGDGTENGNGTSPETGTGVDGGTGAENDTTGTGAPSGTGLVDDGAPGNGSSTGGSADGNGTDTTPGTAGTDPSPGESSARTDPSIGASAATAVGTRTGGEPAVSGTSSTGTGASAGGGGTDNGSASGSESGSSSEGSDEGDTSSPKSDKNTDGAEDTDESGRSGSGASDSSSTTTPIQTCAAGGSANSTTGTAPSGSSTSRTGGASNDAGPTFSLTNGLEGFLPATEKSGDVEKGGKNPVAAPSPNVKGRTAIKVDVPSGAERSEVQPKAAQDIKAGQHMAFGISDFLPHGFPVNTRGGWQVIWQLHDGGTNGSPPVALEVAQGRLWLSNVGQHVKDLGAVTAGRNLAVQLDIAFAKDAGTVSVIRDGQQMLTDFKPPKGTMVDDSDYLKTGVYKDPGTDDGDATLFINDEKIGSTMAQVGNLAGATTGPAGSPAQQ